MKNNKPYKLSNTLLRGVTLEARYELGQLTFWDKLWILITWPDLMPKKKSARERK